MKWLKNAGVIFLLTVLTVCTVLFPRAVTDRSKKTLLLKKTFWNYSGRADTELDSVTVARLLYNSDTSVEIYRSNIYDSQSAEAVKMQKSAEMMFEEVFKYDSSACDFMKKVIGESSSFYKQKKVITALNGRSFILDITEVEVGWESANILFSFEEKTNTLISFLYESKNDGVFYDTQLPLKSIEAAVGNYYVDLLSEEQYYCQSEIGEEYSVFESGITRREDKYFKEEN